MSFILDALKKADAERHIGKMPGIHAHPAMETLPHVASRNGPRLYVVFAVLMVGAGIAAVYALHGFGPGAQEPVRASAPALAQPASGQTTPRAATPPPVARPAIIASEIPVPPPLPKPVAQPKKEAVPLATAAVALESRTTAKALQADDRAGLPTLNQLPPTIRSELPPLAFNGSLYAANPADRMLLVGKRMLHEGDEVAPGVVLETILPKSAALRYKGFVFRMPY